MSSFTPIVIIGQHLQSAGVRHRRNWSIAISSLAEETKRASR